ncbi:L-2-amino-thiazoline-4-carboxylic acid hydrolase [Anaerolentibacter hominis]|uniref:L-2-amino-thiazoline-4-carboxylic acid hydrolase n=1 Tax=Anaerolentibacter hominis TaxID=3079009 RepID=UPI0031B80AB7
MSNIKNLSLVFSDEKVAINRKAIEHRATWMGLTYDEGIKAGVDAETIARKAITRTGHVHGANFKAACEDSTDCSQFCAAFLDDLGKTTFQMDVTECTKDDLKIEFHYCPLVSAWQKLGFDDETCAKLCDMAMDGDRGIAAENGLKLDLTDTIAKGCPTCKLHFHK